MQLNFPMGFYSPTNIAAFPFFDHLQGWWFNRTTQPLNPKTAGKIKNDWVFLRNVYLKPLINLESKRCWKGTIVKQVASYPGSIKIRKRD